MADGHDDDRRGTTGTGRPAGQGATALGRAGWRRLTRWTAVAASVAVLLVATAGTILYIRLNGNIRDLPLFAGIGGDAGTEQPDAFGRTPINVLVIGSDSRADAADCRLGGGCGPGQNADVEMVLHIAADRSHAAVLSIPRDTVTRLPACRAPDGSVSPAGHGQINSTLQYGPGCTVAAVHALTKIPIDHFMMADFSGVVRLSDAVGGVPVCVDRDVYDPYSHLKLAKGRHSLQGVAALEFLRSRHAFGDGSDLGRTDAQHLFLSALAGRLREGGSLSDPAGLLALADAATGALTVDTGLAAVPRLVSLANDLREVPSAQVAFTTMPSLPDADDPDRVVASPAARRLFAAIAADLPLKVTGSPPPAGATGSGVTSAGDAGSGSGDDAKTGSAASPSPRPPRAATAPDPDTHGRTATRHPACAEVATDEAVSVRGVPMTPTAAFAATPKIRVSAR
jgi:LCP family protein required for cell wall assembly